MSKSSEVPFLSGGGEMGERIRQFDWMKTPLGSPNDWPQNLKSALRIMLESRYQMFVWWGPQFINFYNDAYRSVLGNRHPHALGRRAGEVWRDIWDTVGPQGDQVLNERKATWHENQLLVMERNGYPEETFFSYSYSPIPNDNDEPGGVFCVCTETTEQVIGGRRLAALRQLAATAASAKSGAEACELGAQALREYDRDVSFALIYLVDADGGQARLCARSGITSGLPTVPATVDLRGETGLTSQFWPFQNALRGERGKVTDWPAGERLHGGPWPEPTKTAVLLPLKGSHEQPIGFILLGASPRLEFDDNYEGFFELIAGNLTSAITNARAYEHERRRAEDLAALDRAKTVFFSNVSHELRTPLTLMLAPLEDVLSFRNGILSKEISANLEVAHRNSLRLLKLVNTLLDFARIEAGRIEAHFEPTDLAAFTTELASVFRSAIEKAGLKLVVDCPPLPEPVFIDREMWEKIILNLLSNAFKFTFTGTITVTLRWFGERVELSVRDTGVGIPESDLQRVFERFHRVRGTQSRTHEGTGIGLSLVQELAHLHGGEVKVQSREGHGSEFIVSVQTGKSHLPADHLRSPEALGETMARPNFYAEESFRWLPEGPTAGPEKSPLKSNHPRRRIFLADDNADMREYVRRLLADQYDVETAPDGLTALESIRTSPPDLVLADVMMPRLDGFALLRQLRKSERTRTIPIIMLSARAGEESRVEGLNAGADDYMIKPFSARELMARVQSQLELTHLRRLGQDRIKRVLDSITDGFYVLDAEGCFLELNAAARSMFSAEGVDVVTLIGQPWFEIFPEARTAGFGEALDRASRKREAVDIEAFYSPWNRWYFFRSRPLPEGGVATFFQDITERKRAEMALRESEERYRALVTATSDVVYQMSPDWTEMRHLDGRDFIPDTGDPSRTWLQKYIHLDDQPLVLNAIKEAIRTKGPFELEHRVIRVGGTLGWTFSRAIPLFDESGDIKEWFGAASDITERKEAEEALKASEAHLELVSNTVPTLISYIDRDGRYRSCNRAYSEWFGGKREDYVGRPTREVVGDQVWRAIEPYLKKAFAGKTVEFEMEAHYPSGDPRWIHVYYTPHQNAAGEVHGIVALITDISERKGSEEALHEAQKALREHADVLERTVAERTAKLRETVSELESFSYSIAHDMRAPLRSMRGFSEILVADYADQLGGDAKDYLRRISASAARLDRLIQDVLDYSKVLRGEMPLEPVELEHLLREIIESYPDFQEPGATILVQSPLPAVRGNPAALTQVISNLLANAVKFVAPGTTPRVLVRGDRLGSIVRLWFEDNGIGIHPQHLDRIFKIFGRLHSEEVYEGTGIGLVIIRKAVDRMGGRVGVESEPGVGSRFWVELPKS